ncbi:Nucleoside diphosphate kinase IV, chloroplastic/mitochondrial [Gracilariopsis chorda]|uniref:Nucleoside diphosphate kinase n=1 Tax=Gracilariopsis chorda TaxID=448386 RepID=A0A2V3IK70_9FLOR|nr:Nucleoside diphosphate kinase IV, chloroplastic/mitochondrial [Gracilariopsis chorda]|eukprot:PXF42494.1 Nucleoside diphosphate kinase IV, chloroplastic/mitochondrial [Gracilariopsis chorda]
MADSTERSYIMLKPDAVQRGLVGEIVQRFEKRGFKLVALKLVTPSLEMAQKHYYDLAERPFFPTLCKFLSSGPVVAMVFEGEDVIRQGRRMIGATSPLAADPGTIRGDLAIITGKNIIHGSDSKESAEAEIALWFKPEELNSWKKTDVEAWVYE